VGREIILRAQSVAGAMGATGALEALNAGVVSAVAAGHALVYPRSGMSAVVVSNNVGGGDCDVRALESTWSGLCDLAEAAGIGVESNACVSTFCLDTHPSSCAGASDAVMRVCFAGRSGLLRALIACVVDGLATGVLSVVREGGSCVVFPSDCARGPCTDAAISRAWVCAAAHARRAGYTVSRVGYGSFSMPAGDATEAVLAYAPAVPEARKRARSDGDGDGDGAVCVFESAAYLERRAAVIERELADLVAERTAILAALAAQRAV
jgi:hypothetical protein